MKKFIKIILFALVLSLVVGTSFFASPAKADEPKSISTVEDLKAIAQNPSGSYVLADDINLAGAEWTPFEFSGTLDGNGHAIMNFTISSVPSGTATVYDANLKEYQAAVAGFFTKMSNATVKNLQLLGGEIQCSTTDSTFIGELAGYAYNSTIDNCMIIGKSALTTSGHCAGVAGVIGFAGNCSITGCTVETILLYTDTDVEYKEEQFMGGVYAFGYGTVKGCKVRIDGYDADHGYVHNGGLIGTFMYYDGQNYSTVEITNNSIDGMITFYEDNEDRRAYCESEIGEIMNWEFTFDGNDASFVRNEIYDYVSLEAHSACGNHSITTQTVPSRTGRAGYTIDMCENCSYIYKYKFTAPLEGTFINPAVQKFDAPLEGKTDLLVISSHADDEQLFFAGVLPYYSQVRGLAVQVVYGTDPVNEPDRYAERENGLWNVGITNQCDSSGWVDLYAETIDQALWNLQESDGITGEDQVIEWVRQIILKYKPQVIITHDRAGEYNHGFHQLMADALEKCVNQYGSEFPFLKKVYLHLAGENAISINVIDQKQGALNGLTAFQVTQKYGFTEHVSQHWTWFYDWLYYGVNSEEYRGDPIYYASQIGSYSPLQWGMIYGDASLDVNKNDLFEGLQSYAEIEAAKYVEPETESAPVVPEKKTSGKISTTAIIIGIIILLIIIIVIIIIITRNNKKKAAAKRRKAAQARRAAAQQEYSERPRTQRQEMDSLRVPRQSSEAQRAARPQRTSEQQRISRQPASSAPTRRRPENQGQTYTQVRRRRPSDDDE